MIAGVFTLPLYASIAPEGHWEGNIELPGAKLEIRVDLASPASGDEPWAGTIDIPAQTIRGYDLADVSIQDNAVSFRMPNIPGDPTFEGALTEEGTHISGVFTQNGQSFPFALKRGERVARLGETPSHGVSGVGLAGHWQGSLRMGPSELRLVLHVNERSDGAYEATLDSVDQGALGLPISKIEYASDFVRLELKRLGAGFEGKMSDDGSELAGVWKQGPVEAPLVFRRLAAAPQLARPQEPKRPFPYDESEVSFEGGTPEVILSGTLTMPKGEGPFPAVVLLSGSGPQDRDESLMGHRPFLVLADHLTRRGIAVLRYDDRGFGKSTGKHSLATHEDFAADARAAFRFLTAQAGIDGSRVGLCGHSEGGVHAPLVAAEETDVAFIVMLAGVGVPLEALLRRQREDVLRVMGVDEESRQEQHRLGTAVFAALREHGATEEARERIRKLISEAAEQYTPAQRSAMGLTDGMIRQQSATMTTPWFVDLLVYDPRPTLAKVKCPVLALNGEKDVQVAADENLAGIQGGLRAGGNERVTIKKLPGLNHLFQTAISGAISEYGSLEETMSPVALELVSEWILQLGGA